MAKPTQKRSFQQVREDWGPHAFGFLSVLGSIFFGLMPLWVNALMLNNFSGGQSLRSPVTLRTLIEAGDFALFSASLLGTCIILAFKDQYSSLLWRMLCVLLPVAGIFFAIFMYTGVIVQRVSAQFTDQFKLNMDYLNSGSMWLFWFTVAVMLYFSLREALSSPDQYRNVLSSTKGVSDRLKNLV